MFILLGDYITYYCNLVGFLGGALTEGGLHYTRGI